MRVSAHVESREAFARMNERRDRDQGQKPKRVFHAQRRAGAEGATSFVRRTKGRRTK